MKSLPLSHLKQVKGGAIPLELMEQLNLNYSKDPSAKRLAVFILKVLHGEEDGILDAIRYREPSLNRVWRQI